jgi:hypothetical protein
MTSGHTIGLAAQQLAEAASDANRENQHTAVLLSTVDLQRSVAVGRCRCVTDDSIGEQHSRSGVKLKLGLLAGSARPGLRHIPLVTTSV